MVGADGAVHAGIGRQLGKMEFRVAAGQIERLRLRQRRIVQRGKKAELRPERLQEIEIGAVEKGKGGVTGDGDALPVQTFGLRQRRCGGGKGNGWRLTS